MPRPILNSDPNRADWMLRRFGEFGRDVELRVDQDYRTVWPIAEFYCRFSNESLRVSGEWAEPAMHAFAEQFGPLYAQLRSTGAPRDEVRDFLRRTGLRVFNRCYQRAERHYLDRMPRRHAGEEALLRAQNLFAEAARHFVADFGERLSSSDFAPGAEEKAEETMLRYLTPEQAQEWREHKHFTVNLSGRAHPKRHGNYRINRNRSFNCEHLETGVKYCVVPDTRLPICDQMLATKLMLEGETEKFFKTANKIDPLANRINPYYAPMHRVHP